MPIQYFIQCHLQSYIDVLMLFVIPWGGGIPAGVVLAQNKGITWPTMAVLYFISDILLAAVFEPCLKLFIAVARNNPRMQKFVVAAKNALDKTTQQYGYNLSPFAMVMISFGADPMTGRAVTHASGHGFVTGWLIAITGDMFYFLLVMSCTLWLKSVLGDGTWVVVIITALTLLGPYLYRRVFKREPPKPPKAHPGLQAQTQPRQGQR